MTMSAQRWRRAGAAARNFANAQDGIAAVELALIAAPFFFILFAIIEVALIAFASSALEIATDDAAREIRTGRFQSGDEQIFKDALCDRAAMIRCEQVRIDVRSWDNFGAINPGAPVSADGELDDSQFGFDSAATESGAIVLVRVFYEWPVVTPLLGQVFSNMSGNRRLLTAASAFRNEPFGE